MIVRNMLKGRPTKSLFKGSLSVSVRSPACMFVSVSLYLSWSLHLSVSLSL